MSAKVRRLTIQLNAISGFVDGLEAAIAALPQNNSLATGTNSIGTVQPGNVANTTPWKMDDDGTQALLAPLPVSRGSKADIDSLGVTQSTEDKAIQAAIQTAVQAVSAIIANGSLAVYIKDALGNAISWAAPSTGAVSTTPASPVSVSTSTTVWAGDTSVREVIIRNPSTNSAGVACLFAAAAATIANSSFEIYPGQSLTTGRDGYTGEIRCIALSGTQSIAVTKIN
jgi:hypothetical protein